MPFTQCPKLWNGYHIKPLMASSARHSESYLWVSFMAVYLAVYQPSIPRKTDKMSQSEEAPHWLIHTGWVTRYLSYLAQQYACQQICRYYLSNSSWWETRPLCSDPGSRHSKIISLCIAMYNCLTHTASINPPSATDTSLIPGTQYQIHTWTGCHTLVSSNIIIIKWFPSRDEIKEVGVMSGRNLHRNTPLLNLQYCYVTRCWVDLLQQGHALSCTYCFCPDLNSQRFSALHTRCVYTYASLH